MISTALRKERMHFSGVEVHLCRFTSSENRLVRYAPEIKQPLSQTSKKSLAKGFPPTPADGLMRVSEPLPIDGVEVILFSPIASGKWIAYYFTYLKYEVVARKYIHSTNWLERFNGQIKKGARYNRCALPSIDSALHLIGNIALNTTYLRKKIGDLTAGLRKVK